MPNKISKAIITPIILTLFIGANLISGMLLVNTSKQAQITLSHLEALKRNQENVKRLESDITSYSGKIAQIQQILPKEANIPAFIQFISDSASNLGLKATLDFTADQPTKTKSGLFFIPFSLQLQASKDNLVKYLSVIQGSNYQLRLDHLDTQINEDSSLSFMVSGQLFVSPEFAAPNK